MPKDRGGTTESDVPGGFRARPLLLEACVTGVREAAAAIQGGANRLELCTRLEVGGLTPRTRLVQAVVTLARARGIPVFAMIRQRPGDFRLRPGDVGRMIDRVRAFREAGAAGIVIGCLGENRTVDEEAVAALVAAAHPLPVTFHRAFDESPDLDAAYETLARLGTARILTGGGPGTAWEGRAALARLVGRSNREGGPAILGAGGIRADHLADLLAETGLQEIHARAEAFPALGRAARM